MKIEGDQITFELERLGRSRDAKLGAYVNLAGNLVDKLFRPGEEEIKHRLLATAAPILDKLRNSDTAIDTRTLVIGNKAIVLEEVTRVVPEMIFLGISPGYKHGPSGVVRVLMPEHIIEEGELYLTEMPAINVGRDWGNDPQVDLSMRQISIDMAKGLEPSNNFRYSIITKVQGRFYNIVDEDTVLKFGPTDIRRMGYRESGMPAFHSSLIEFEESVQRKLMDGRVYKLLVASGGTNSIDQQQNWRLGWQGI